jgi:hypothetical protein
MQVRSPMIVSVGMYLPFGTTFAICLGGLIKGAVEKLGDKKGFNEAQKTRVENVGVLVAAGLIAGEALVGLLFATFAFFDVKYQLNALVWGRDALGNALAPGAFWISLLILAIVAAVLIRVPMKNPGSPDQPAPPKA